MGKPKGRLMLFTMHPLAPLAMSRLPQQGRPAELRRCTTFERPVGFAGPRVPAKYNAQNVEFERSGCVGESGEQGIGRRTA